MLIRSGVQKSGSGGQRSGFGRAGGGNGGKKKISEEQKTEP